ncbi:helix-turn-helix domain-containing protein [Metapseudomonas sp. CR1201]
MYQYSSCGLEYVFLKNGYTIKETPYGQAVSIDDIEGLHRAIALDIMRQKTPLTGQQFRFLRKEQDLTQAELAAILGVSEQTVAAWEKLKKEPVQMMADISMRAYYLAHMQVMRLPQVFPSPAGQTLGSISFEHDANGWLPKAA